MAPPSDRRQPPPRHRRRQLSPLFFNPNYLQPSSSVLVVPSEVGPPSPPFVPQLSPQELRNTILNQIEFYFSDDNLARDVYLKQHMDDNGWVPITFIASFPRIESLTKDIGLILFTLISSSQTVEVEGKNVRRRTSWNKWILDATMRKCSSDGLTIAVRDTDTDLSLPDPSPPKPKPKPKPKPNYITVRIVEIDL